MTRRHTAGRRLMGAIAVISAAGLLATGCARGGGGDEASPGITDTTIKIGISTPLSGTTAGPGQCTVDGAKAYFEAANAAGGIEFGDGKTRTVEILTYDNAYDPQKARGNYQEMTNDGVFAAAFGLGTPTNLAWRDAAIEDEFPQVLLQTGDPVFSDREESPWQLGLIAAYPQEGRAFGEALVASGEKHTIAVLAANDDVGEGYVQGLREGIEGSDDVEIVAELTYEATDTSIDAQVAELAGSGADIFYANVTMLPLMIGALQKAQQIGWTPSWALPSNSASPTAVLEPGQADAYPGIYSVAFAQTPDETTEEGAAFLDALHEYTGQTGVPQFPHCTWSWIGAATLEQAFMQMQEPTRDSFMQALLNVSDFEAPLMLEGARVDTTIDGTPAIAELVVQKFDGTAYTTVDAVG